MQERETQLKEPQGIPVPLEKLASDPGLTWELIVEVVLFLGFLGGFVVWYFLVINRRDPGLGIPLLIVIIGICMFVVAPRLTNRYRDRQRKVMLRADELIQLDPRPPVLYLRSFKDDEKIARAIAFQSIEQEMKVVFFDFGPFIAFAEPNAEALDPGAGRLYASQEKWQDEVRNEMVKARLVVMRIGATPSFWWEVEQARGIVTPERLIFFIPGEKVKSEYEEFCLKANRLFPHGLPKYEYKWSPTGPPGGIIYFDQDWTPHLRLIKTLWLRQTFWNLFSAPLKLALKPVYEQHGVQWAKPPVRAMQVLYMLVLLFLSVFFVYGSYKVVQMGLRLFRAFQ